MKVNGISTNQLSNLYKDSSREKNVNTNSEAAKDSISISSIGKSLSSYFTDDNIIDYKEEKVNSIKKAIANGTYKVDAKLVAQKIIDNMKGRI
ncbi:flagellar biosynthesis anti-sigma factor FlgM [Clostridium sp. cel8]|jgi:negative regulator of flagellin synthesis FlgM|uniref:flagellar biosynthesis anti-sigma factor FlgM n=1 Tax=unclassified Clostridium TaxID=2614128 RepID=UPI0015F38707|nr:flagellar biosynthesis anti-sigma factor FlgM [Clostridium sp. cel8]MBA5851088.1 flagellar biosynthesis anti-sigma factor FlgM [Clostridium sp. cel8]